VGYIGIWFAEALLKESLLLRASLSPRSTPLHVKTLEPAMEESQKHEILIR